MDEKCPHCGYFDRGTTMIGYPGEVCPKCRKSLKEVKK